MTLFGILDSHFLGQKAFLSNGSQPLLKDRIKTSKLFHTVSAYNWTQIQTKLSDIILH